MGNTNFTVDIQFEEAKQKAQEMAQQIVNMESILNYLDEEIKGMTWTGNRAADFKRRIDEAKTELDDVYRNYVTKIPEVAEASIRKYKQVEEA